MSKFSEQLHKVEAEAPRGGQPRVIERDIFPNLDESSRKDLMDALKNADIPSTWIAKTLQEMGFTIGSSAVGKYRKII